MISDILTQARCLKECRPSLSVISAAFMAFYLMSTTQITDGGMLWAYRQILLVCEDQEKSISKLVLVQHTLQLLARFHDTVTIIAVHHKDDALGVLKVMPPQRSDFVLSTHIPHGELNILVFDGLDVEA